MFFGQFLPINARESCARPLGQWCWVWFRLGICIICCCALKYGFMYWFHACFSCLPTSPSSHWWFACSFLPLYYHTFANALLFFFFFLDKSMFFDSPPLFTSNIFSTFSHSPAQMPCVKFLSRALPQLIFCTKWFVNISLLFIVLLPGVWIFAWHQCNLLVCAGDRVLSWLTSD